MFAGEDVLSFGVVGADRTVQQSCHGADVMRKWTQHRHGCKHCSLTGSHNLQPSTYFLCVFLGCLFHKYHFFHIGVGCQELAAPKQRTADVIASARRRCDVTHDLRSHTVAGAEHRHLSAFTTLLRRLHETEGGVTRCDRTSGQSGRRLRHRTEQPDLHVLAGAWFSKFDSI